MSKRRSLSSMVLLLCLSLIMPLSASAEEEMPHSASSQMSVNERDDEGFHPTLSYGNVSLHDFYGEQWDGWSLGLFTSAFAKKYYGISLGFHGIEARTDEQELEGRFTSTGVEMLFLLSTKMKWLRPFVGLGAGAHYNYIDVNGKKEFERSGYGFSLIGEAGLRVITPMNFKAFGKPANLVLGGYARYFHSKEYFYENDFSDDQADFPGNEYGAYLGLILEM